jgi:hypothetical protein
MSRPSYRARAGRTAALRRPRLFPAPPARRRPS